MRRMIIIGVAVPAAVFLLSGRAGLPHTAASTNAPNACPAGYACLDTGKDETGTEYKIAVPAGAHKGDCYVIKIPPGTKVVSADNETKVRLDLGPGVCGSGGDPNDVIPAGVRENLYDPIESNGDE